MFFQPLNLPTIVYSFHSLQTSISFTLSKLRLIVILLLFFGPYTKHHLEARSVISVISNPQHKLNITSEGSGRHVRYQSSTVRELADAESVRTGYLTLLHL